MASRRRRPFEITRGRRRQVPYRWVWREIHGQRMRVKLYPPAGSPELAEVDEPRIYFGRLPAWRGEP